MAKINPKLAAVLPAPLHKRDSTAMVSKGFKKVLEPEMIPIVEQALLMGLPFERVAGLVCVSRKLLRKWVDEGAEETCTDALKIELAATVERAYSQTNLEFADNFMAIGKTGDAKALHIVAKAFDRETWGERKELKIDATVEAKAQHKDLSNLTDEEFEQYMALEAKASAKKLP